MNQVPKVIEFINSSPKLGEVPEGQRGMAHQKQLYINIIKKAKHLSYSPQPALSASMGCASPMSKQVLPLASTCTIGLS